MAGKSSRFKLTLVATLVIYAAAWALTDLPPSPLRFTDERIVMTVTDRNCDINGWYKFRNVSPFPRSTRFFYPFPLHDADYPDLIEAFWLQGGAKKPLEFKKLSDGISYRLKVPGSGETQFVIHYRQKLHAKRAVYIVTTTQSWRRPLDSAIFEIHHPAHWENVRYTYPGKVMKSDGQSVFRLIEWHHYMPRKEIEMTWRD